MRPSALALAALCACSAGRGASALYFYLEGNAERCFLEEVPADTLVVGKYKSPDVLPWGAAGWAGAGVGSCVVGE
jgi:hypothetical protein